jgi:hypothetical protein
MQLRANGHDVYGFGERKTPDPFVNACTTFLDLDRLGEEGGGTAVRSDTKGVVAAAEDATPAKAAPKAKPTPEVKNSKPPLSQDAKLVAVLRGAVEATAGDDGWAPLDAAGSAARRQAPIDPRNYGARNFPKLFEGTGLFDIVKAEETGQSYIADKRNKERTPKPRF